jgi:hypothetical protein
VPSRRTLLGALFAFTVAYAVFALLHMFPPAPYGMADDWRVFMATGLVLAHAGNPYDPATMHAAEQVVDHYPHVQPSLDDFTDLPVVGVFLRAFSWLPFWWSYAIFTAVGLGVAAVAMWSWLGRLGWRGRGPWVLAALLSWPLLVGVFSGQLDLLMLGGTVGGLLLMRRGAPWLAGLCMVVVLLKPHILWPLPLLLGAAWAAEPAQLRRFAAAAVAAIGGGTLLGFLLVAHSAAFFPHLLGFESRVSAVQPDLAGLPGLIAPLPGGGLAGDLIAGAGVLGVIALVVVAAGHPRLRALSPDRRSLIPLAGLGLWLALTPYAHPNDDVLLFPLVAVVVGEEGRALDPRWMLAGAVLSLALIAGFVISGAVGAALLVLAVLGWALGRDRVPAGAAPALALCTLALLPTIWPFHLVPVSLTPIAIALVAAAGLLDLRQAASAVSPQPENAAAALRAQPAPSGVSGPLPV